MNLDRLLRDVDARLEHLPEETRQEVRDAIREEAVRARRRSDPAGTLEEERERRVQAETLREVLEAINRQARLEDTIEEVLRQLARVVQFDSCSIALLDGDESRVLAAKGFPETVPVVGLRFRSPLIDAIRAGRWPVSVADVREDPRWVTVADTGPIRSWAGLPLLVEGDVIGILNIDRHRVDPFTEDDLHRARSVAFSAAAAIRNAQVLEQVRGYAQLMEQVVAVDQAVLARRPLDDVRAALLAGAVRLGGYAGGLLVEGGSGEPVVTAADDALASLRGRTAPAELWSSESRRLAAGAARALGEGLDVDLPAGDVLVVPLQTDDALVATLALIDTGGDTPRDRLVEAYASRIAAAFTRALSDC